MKRIAMAAMLASQAMGGTPAAAAGLEPEARMSAQDAGAFAGARLRIPFGGVESGKARASVALAPTMRGPRSDGSVRTRFGHGIELGASGDQKLRLSIGGTPVSQLAAGGRAPEGPKAGISALGWVGIGVGLAAVAFVAWFAHEMNDCDPHDDEC